MPSARESGAVGQVRAIRKYPSPCPPNPFPGVKSKFTPALQAFLDAHKDARGTVYQTAVNYVNPQWMDIGKDLTAMFTGAMQPKDVLTSIDKRRADLAKAAKDPAWQ